MHDKLLVSVVIAVFFVLCKFIDVRFIQKQPSTPPKHLAKDAAYTFISSLCGLYIVEYIGGDKGQAHDIFSRIFAIRIYEFFYQISFNICFDFSYAQNE